MAASGADGDGGSRGTQMAHPNENLLREGFGHLLRIAVINAVEGPYYVADQAQFN